MDKNSLNTNKQFMIGNGMLAFGVFAVIIIFFFVYVLPFPTQG